MIRSHWRLALGVAAGTLAWAAAIGLRAPEELRLLIGWDVGAGLYLTLAWRLFLTAGEADVRAHAAREDEARSVILALVVVAVIAAVYGIIAAMIDVRGDVLQRRAVTAGFSALTLLVSWLVLQSVFVAHYAHRHFQTLEAQQAPGFIFPGEAASSYRDFIYLAICIGATAQVSDPGVATTRLRNLVTTHAAIAFFYNTTILALGINILAGLVGR